MSDRVKHLKTLYHILILKKENKDIIKRLEKY